jgi:hypothetical protein
MYAENGPDFGAASDGMWDLVNLFNFLVDMLIQQCFVYLYVDGYVF